MELIFTMYTTLFVTGPTLELLQTIPHRHQRRANATLVSLFSHHTSASIRGHLREYRWERKKKCTLSVTPLRSQGTRFQGICPHTSNFVGCTWSLCSPPPVPAGPSSLTGISPKAPSLCAKPRLLSLVYRSTDLLLWKLFLPNSSPVFHSGACTFSHRAQSLCSSG